MGGARHEWDPRRGRDGRVWRRLVAELCPPGSWCLIPECDKPSREILFGLRPSHPLGPSLDHIVPLDDGGHPTDPGNLRPAHLGCNAARGARMAAAKRARGRVARPQSRRLRDVPPFDPMRA